jgi:GAF domain-containing protein
VLPDLARVLSAVGPALAPVGNERMLQSITDTAREIFGAAACSLAMLTDDADELVYTTASGAGADTVVGMRIASGQGIAGWVVNSEQPLEVRDLQRDARFARNVAESTGYVPQALLAVPVASPRRLLGVLSVLDRDTARPDAAHDMRLLQLFADQAALAIEGARVFADLGTAVLQAVAAARPESDLAETLSAAAQAAGPPDADLLQVAAVLAELDAAGPDERRLAVTLLTDVLEYARRRRG